MLTGNSNPYYYFLFSTEHINKENEVESAQGRRFVCGEVVVDGKRKKFSYKTTDRTFFMKQYPDAKVVASGYKNNMTYTDCSVDRKRGT